MSRVNVKYSRGKSKIEWTGRSWNVTIGCTPIAPGCDNCYAMKLAMWMRQMYLEGDQRYKDYVDGFKPKMILKRLDLPARWDPSLVFVNSMSDSFHKAFPYEFLIELFGRMVKYDHHIYQILTKRAERALELSEYLPWPENVWMGVSVGCRDRLSQIDLLRQIPAHIRFLSLEPLLEDLGELDLSGIHWVIIGGESPGISGMRPCRLEWIENIVRQCDQQGVAVFVKQLGGVQGIRLGMMKDGKFDTKGGDFSLFPEHLQRREYPIDVTKYQQ